MLEFYELYSPGPENVMLMRKIRSVIKDYQEQGLTLTLRQLFYQLVSRNIIKNSKAEYEKIGGLVSKGRRGGQLDWDAIEDRIRVPKVPQEFESIDDLMEVALRAYRLPRMRGQAQHVELWVEKDAIAGVLAPIASKYHITLMVNRGYSSTSAMKEAGERVRTHCKEMCVDEATIFYLGDFDPAGEDMVRDVSERLREYTNNGIRFTETKDAEGKYDLTAETEEERQARRPWIDVRVEKIALTMEQIEEYNPPPNPVKVTDSKAKKYRELHGDSSWEVDALPPVTLRDIIESKLEEAIDEDVMDLVIAQEERDKRDLRAALAAVKRGDIKEKAPAIVKEIVTAKKPALPKSKKKVTKKKR